jgi:anti-sigma regulatory factor (Ser/Thr protein kinase)
MSFHLKLVMQSDPRVLSVARAAVSELAKLCGFSEDDCQAITVAVDEALANVIRHAYKHRHDQEMQLAFQIDEDRIEFRLLDQGEAPDPDRICGQPLNDFSLSGRGTHMIKAVMDDMCYETVQEGNQLRLVKLFPKAEVGVADEAASKPHS